MDRIIEQSGSVWNEAADIWLQGGWAMIGIAIIALVLFGSVANTWLSLRRKGFTSVNERMWRRWITHPEERTGPIGEILDYVMAARSLKESRARFDDVRCSEVKPFSRDLKFIQACVSAAPLVGLLGTVTGMLTTFSALSSGSGGDKTMQLIASGISEALVTTMTGLVIALPGLFLQYQLSRLYQRYMAFMSHLESVCTQDLYRRLEMAARKAA